MYEPLRGLLETGSSTTLGGLLIGGALKAFFVLLVAGVVALALRRRSAAKRHLAWSLAVGIALLLPFVSPLLPRIQIEVPGLSVPVSRAAAPTASPTASPTAAPAVAPTASGSGAERAWSGPAAGRAESAPRAEGAGASSTRRPTAAAPAPSASAASASTTAAPDRSARSLATSATPAAPMTGGPDGPPGAATILLGIWLAGVGLGLGHLLLGASRLRWLELQSESIGSGRLLEATERACRRLGLARTPVVLRGDDKIVPMTWGLLRPRIILPAGAEAWPSWRLEAVLLHELGHIARRDYAAQVMAQVVCSLHWFNPLAWVAAGRMRVERELACDDLVVSTGHEPSSYARDLLELARTCRPLRLTTRAAICLARPNRLRDRLVALLDESRDRRPISRAAVVRAFVVTVALAIPLAGLTPVPEAASRDQDSWNRSTAVSETSVGARPPTRSADARERFRSNPISVTTAKATETIPTVPFTQLVAPGPSGSPPVRTSATVRQEAAVLCGPADGDSHSHSTNTSDDRMTIEMTYGDCDASIRIEGDIAFSEDFTSIASLSTYGFLRIELRRDGERRRVEVRPGSGGQPVYEWRVDGREQPFDAPARRWLESALLDVFRSSGFKARERAAWILGRDGVDGLLNEVGHMWSSHGKSRYLTVALETGDLSQPEIRRVMDAASRQIDSDHALGQVLAAAAENYSFDPATRGAFIEAAATLESDHQHAQVLEIALNRGGLSQENLEALLQSATLGLQSDHLMGGILLGLAERYPLDPGLRSPFLGAASTLQSDHQKAAVYGMVLSQPGLDAGELGAVLEAASTIGSDHNLSRLLIGATSHDMGDPALTSAYLRTAATIESDHNLAEVLRALVELDSDPALMTSMLDTAGREIDSDHLLAELLVTVAERHTLEGSMLEAFMRALGTIESRHQRERVESAVRR